jgi:hypothetical protein
VDDPRELVRSVVEGCWSDSGGVERMRGCVASDYIHHTAWGDCDFEQFREGVEWVDSVFADRRYRVEHVVAEDGMVAAFLTWTGTRRADGSAVEGRGAYHCRIADGLIAEDWDVFFPAAD